MPQEAPLRRGSLSLEGKKCCGEVAEWLKAHAWKACIRETVSRVRIPLSPPNPLEKARTAIPRNASYLRIISTQTYRDKHPYRVMLRDPSSCSLRGLSSLGGLRRLTRKRKNGSYVSLQTTFGLSSFLCTLHHIRHQEYFLLLKKMEPLDKIGRWLF